VTYTLPANIIDPITNEPMDPPPDCLNATVYVRAKSNASGGSGGKTFEFVADGVSKGGHRLGGFTPATTSNEINLLSNESMQTVLVNDGAAATFLLRLEWSGTHYKLMAVDQSSGVGLASRLNGSGAAIRQRWVIATPTEATREGAVRLVRNDVANGDVDADGLGNNLEVEACTCSTTAAVSCGSFSVTCSGVANRQDTDSDGLADGWELIGFDDTSAPQLFPLWGRIRSDATSSSRSTVRCQPTWPSWSSRPEWPRSPIGCSRSRTPTVRSASPCTSIEVEHASAASTESAWIPSAIG
jgi:hypothetical protein